MTPHLESGGVYPLPEELRMFRREAAVAEPPQGSGLLGSLADRLRSGFPRWRKPGRRLLIIAALLVGLAALRTTVFAAKPVVVEVVRVTRGAVEQTVSNTRAGTVKARLRARVSPEISGRVVALPHREGARVHKGALLLRLDASMQQAQLDLAMEDVRAAAARAEETCLAADHAVTQLRRIAELRRGGIASEQLIDSATSERDRSRAACAAAAASRDQARARERLARVALSHTELRAPFAGVVAEVNTEVGEWIAPALPGFAVASAVELLDPASVYVTAPIDEMDAERVEQGQEVRLAVDSRRGEPFRGHLVRVAPYVLDLVEQNRTVEVEADLDDPQLAASLLPGTSADVEVILSRLEGVLQIPTQALGDEGKVLVVVDGVLEERMVRTGLRNWRQTEVQEGLEEGELVVVSRHSTAIKPGARVEAREQS